jgi:phosphatidylglycerol:prolipoprotein diacylglycerol transferase
MFPILHIGPLAIQAPGLFLLAGIWVALNVVEREAPRYKISAAVVSNLILIGLLAGILGARLWYAIRFFSVYLENPLSLFSLNPSTLAAEEGILTGLMAAIIYGQRKGLRLWPSMDVLAPGLAVFNIALGISHLASGDAFGAPSKLPWALELWGELRHPTQVYEIIIAILILVLLWKIREWKVFPGFVFLSWLGLTALSRLLIEAFRGDSVIMAGSLRSAQVISLGVLVLVMVGMHVLGRRQINHS